MERIGRYRILRRVSSGGMGVVYLGVAEGIGGFERHAAIKMLNPEHRDRLQCVAMFLDEARIGGLIQHPNLVAVQEIGEHQGDLFIAMDYVHGETLSRVVRRHAQLRRPLPLPFVVEIGASVCDALHAIHRSKVIHADISPQNILVGYDGIVRVTDFGISHAADNMFQGDPATLRGKLAYLAPEQLTGNPQHSGSDLFSLGVVLWECCTGRRMFPADVTPSVAMAHRMATIESLEPPDKHRPDLPAEMTAIVQKALASDPKLRFPDARTMGTVLRSFAIEHCPSVGSQRWEEYMQELFADRIAKRSVEPKVADDELSELLLPTPQVIAPSEPAVAAPAPVPFVEPIPQIDETEEAAITGVWKIQKNRRWIPLLVGFAATIAILVLAGIPDRDKPAEQAPAVRAQYVKKTENEPPPKPRPQIARKKVRVKPKKVPLLFGAEDL